MTSEQFKNTVEKKIQEFENSEEFKNITEYIKKCIAEEEIMTLLKTKCIEFIDTIPEKEKKEMKKIINYITLELDIIEKHKELLQLLEKGLKNLSIEELERLNTLQDEHETISKRIEKLKKETFSEKNIIKHLPKINTNIINTSKLAKIDTLQSLFDMAEPSENTKLIQVFDEIEIMPKKNITTGLMLSYDGDLFNNLKLNNFDKIVYDSISSLFDKGVYEFSAKQLYRYIYNKDDRYNPVDKQLQEINISISKMSLIRVEIDILDEFEKRKIDVTKATWTDYLLNCKMLKLETKNDKNVVYHINEKPIFFKYAEKIGQYTTFNTSMLEIKDQKGKILNLTDTRLNLVYNLILRVRTTSKAKNKRNQRSIILLDTLYDVANVSDKSRTEKKKIKDFVINVFNTWKENQYIKDFELIYKKNKQGKDTQILEKIKIID